MRSRIFAIANQKGGVGKTTTTINLAASLALGDQTVLVVDMDPQGNLTSGVGRKGDHAPAGTIYEALTSESTPMAHDYIVPTCVSGLSLLPADHNLTGAEIELVSAARREQRLRLLLEQVRGRFDYILVDTPPSLGLLTLNTLVAADGVIIPVVCEYFALEGLAALTATLHQVKEAFNRNLEIAGVVLTMTDLRTNLGKEVAAEVQGVFGNKVFETPIPRNIRLGEAPGHGLPVILYDVRSKGAEAYLALAREFLACTRAAPLPAGGALRG
ncbi:MAG: ParA family protein [Acidobacteria bacterium]|nr:ParA family protein [Acidobacteriota bacterium]